MKLYNWITDPEPADEAPWSAVVVLSIAFIYAAISSVFGYFYLNIRCIPNFETMSPRQSLEFGTAINVIAVVAIVAFLVALGATRKSLGLIRGGTKRMAYLGFMAGLVSFPIILPLNELVRVGLGEHKHPMAEMVKNNMSWQVALMAVFSGVLVAPIAEELLFRVIFQGWLQRVVYGKPSSRIWVGWNVSPTPAHEELPVGLDHGRRRPNDPVFIERVLPNIFVSCCFAALHPWPTPIPLFFLSLGFGWLYQKTRSWVACATMHAAFNGINTCLLFLIVGLGHAPPKVQPAPIKASAPLLMVIQNPDPTMNGQQATVPGRINHQ